jgi:hypothetical protein
VEGGLASDTKCGKIVAPMELSPVGKTWSRRGGGLVLVAEGGRVGLEGGGSPWCAWSTQAQRVVK